MITKEMFHRWKKDPVTLDVLKMLSERMEVIAHSLAKGVFLDETSSATKNVGRYLEMMELIELTYDELRGIDADRTQQPETD